MTGTADEGASDREAARADEVLHDQRGRQSLHAWQCRDLLIVDMAVGVEIGRDHAQQVIRVAEQPLRRDDRRHRRELRLERGDRALILLRGASVGPTDTLQPVPVAAVCRAWALAVWFGFYPDGPPDLSVVLIGRA
jgi:hypothetical protein